MVVAVTVASPGLTAVTSPDSGTVAHSLELSHETTLLVASEGATLAESWLVCPTASSSSAPCIPWPAASGPAARWSYNFV